MRNIEAVTLKGPAVAAHSDQSRRAAQWRTIGYGVAIASFFLMVALAWIRPDFNRTEIPDWRPVLALADAAWGKGDLYAARHLYLQVDQIASSQQDWEGLVAAACGMQRLDGVEGALFQDFCDLDSRRDGGGEPAKSGRYCRNRWSVYSLRTGQSGIHGFVSH